MVRQQMAAMSQAKFTFSCSKESGRVSYAPPVVASIAEPAVTQIVSLEGRSEEVSSSSSSSRSDSQGRTASPSSATEGSDAGTERDVDLEAEGEIDDGEVIFVKITQVSLRARTHSTDT